MKVQSHAAELESASDCDITRDAIASKSCSSVQASTAYTIERKTYIRTALCHCKELADCRVLHTNTAHRGPERDQPDSAACMQPQHDDLQKTNPPLFIKLFASSFALCRHSSSASSRARFLSSCSSSLFCLAHLSLRPCYHDSSSYCQQQTTERSSTRW